MNRPPDQRGDYQLREHLHLKGDVWLVLCGRGKKPKVWTYSTLRLEGGEWRWCGNVRKGRGYRYEGRWVADFWENSQNISIEAAFKDEADALEFLTTIVKRYVP